MPSAVISDSVLKSKFRACMMGGLLGDCIGQQAFSLLSRTSISKFIYKLITEEDGAILPHTDDTRMSISVASSLAEKNEVDAKDMAEKFVDDYEKEPDRHYGMHVPIVFTELKERYFDDIFSPAEGQFDGSGSWGNGAAMRIAPIALFGNNRGEEYIMKAAKVCSLITHAHPNGYNGAILQCLAVNLALGLDPSQELDPISFIENLMGKMEKVEATETKPYCESLKKMKEYFLGNWEDVSADEIAETLGNGDDVSALKAVPPAIYSFLRGTKPLMEHFENSNPFLRTLFFAISLGGDRDTIGSMAGSIAGAYYGEDVIPKLMQKRGEMINEIVSLADKLFDAAHKKE